MPFFERLSNGWTIAMNSLKVLKENKQLIVFPILSCISLLLIIGSFGVAVMANADWDIDGIDRPNTLASYALVFAFYIVNYFVVVFFNTALVYCSSLYFKGEEVSVNKGIQFSISRIGAILSWAVFAGTIGAALKILQENLGSIGKIITALIGMIWGIATFFVVPIIANENLGPIDAVKRSVQLMREKWGQSIGASFSFGLIQLGFLLIAVIPAALIWMINPIAGIIVGIVALLIILSIFSAARTIFITSIYLNVTGDPIENYNQQFVDNLFIDKKR